MAKLYVNEKKKKGYINPEIYGHFSEHLGWINEIEWYRMNGMVPQKRQLAVRHPIRTRMIRMFATFVMPSFIIRTVAFGEFPFRIL